MCWISSKQYLYLQDKLSPSYPHLQESFRSHNDIPMAKGHWYCPRSHHPRFIFIFSTLTMSGSQKGSWIQTKVNMYVIISEQLAPAHSWTRSLLELHVHHCLGEPHHLLFPRLRGFPLLIATLRSQMVCLSFSARIPGLEFPETFHEGLILSPNIQPLFGLFFSLLKSCSMFSSSIN